MRLPVNWLREYADLDPATTPSELSEALVRVGLEVERVESAADGLSGPIVVGRVLSAEPEPQKNGKTIRWCSVDVGADEPRGIVCGAPNVTAGGLVVVALPGAVLPGGFAIAARKTYGHISDGMICSVRELGIGDDHAGILVLPESVLADGGLGADALDVLGLRDAVLDIAVTPDRGYCFSMRGLAREASIALGVDFHDVADTVTVLPVDGGAYDVEVSATVSGVGGGCDQFAARAVTGVDATRATPDWMVQRLRQSGMRPISLIVDVTNYVMLETGQPLHAFDRAKLTGPIGVRRATAGETLKTLDDVERTLAADDLVVTDDTGPIALAGVMGGASTEIDDATSEVLLEAAHWDPASILRAVRRHKLPSEAGKRFERGVDPKIAAVALARCVDLLVEHGGATAAPGFTVVGEVPAPTPIRLAADLPQRIAGLPIPAEAVQLRLGQVGCAVTGLDPLIVTPPTWRPDLTDPADLVEEVVRLEGYDRIPATLPSAPPGHGLTEAQKLRRAVSRAVAAVGYTEVLTTPFVPSSVHDVLGWAADDPRHRPMVVVNPLSDAEPELRTSLLPGLLATVVRNTGRGLRDVALFELGRVFLDRDGRPTAPTLGVEHRPTDDQIAAQNAALPEQPRHVGAVAAGAAERPGWWGPGRVYGWADAVELARVIGRQFRVELAVSAAHTAPWHPGRCAALSLDGRVIGHAGELHPRVVTALGLPERTIAMELDFDAFEVPAPAKTPSVSGFPPVLLDLALVVASDVPAAEVAAAVRDGAGHLLESVRLFDRYSDAERLGPGLASLAFALRFRAADRTLTIEEATAARDRAVAEAATRVGARLRT
jgi:phenylalanyl-tRNA synthetase beta chain